MTWTELFWDHIGTACFVLALMLGAYEIVRAARPLTARKPIAQEREMKNG